MSSVAQSERTRRHLEELRAPVPEARDRSDPAASPAGGRASANRGMPKPEPEAEEDYSRRWIWVGVGYGLVGWFHVFLAPIYGAGWAVVPHPFSPGRPDSLTALTLVFVASGLLMFATGCALANRRWLVMAPWIAASNSLAHLVFLPVLPLPAAITLVADGILIWQTLVLRRRPTSPLI